MDSLFVPNTDQGMPGLVDGGCHRPFEPPPATIDDDDDNDEVGVGTLFGVCI
jgi:hypothetical protein